MPPLEPRAGGENAVGAVGEHRRRALLPARGIGERIGAADPQRRRNLDVRLDLFGAGDEAVGVAMQEGNIERADRADLAGLGGQRRLGAGEEARLIFAKHRAENVRLHIVERATVDLQEFHVGIGGGDVGQHVVELEADGDDDLRARLRRRLEILVLRRRVGAFVGLGLAAERFGGALRSDLAEFEEVVHPDRIGGDIDEQRLGVIGETEADGDRQGRSRRPGLLIS